MSGTWGQWRLLTKVNCPDASYVPDGEFKDPNIWMMDQNQPRSYGIHTNVWVDSYNQAGSSGGQASMKFRSDGQLVALILDRPDAPVFAYDVDTDTWDDGTVLSPLPPGRRRDWGHAIVGEEILVIGGSDAFGGPIVTAYAYNVETDVWRQIAYPFGTTHTFWGKGTEVDGKVWYWTSTYDDGGSPLAAIYDPATDTWTTMPGTFPFGSSLNGINVATLITERLILVVPNIDNESYLYDIFDATYTSTSNPDQYHSVWDDSNDLVQGAARAGDTVYAWGYGGTVTGRFDQGIAMARSSDVPFLQANDRYQVIAAVDAGTGTSTVEIRYWYANAPSWGEELSGDTAFPSYYPYDEQGSYTLASLELPFKVVKVNQEATVDGVLVDFNTRPSEVNQTITTGQFLGFTARVEGYGVPSYSRSVSSTSTTGVVVSVDQSYSDALESQTGDAWPNTRTVYLPMHLPQRIRAARVVLTDVHHVEIVRVQILGKMVPLEKP